MSRKGILLQRIGTKSPWNLVIPAGMIKTDANGYQTLNTVDPVFTDLSTTGNTTLGNAATDTTTINGVLTASVGVQASAVAATATATGATTGTIPAGASFVSVTSTDAGHLVKLPAPVLGTEIKILEATAVGFNVIPAATTQYINGTLVDGSKKLAAAAGVGTLVFLCTVGGAAGKRVQYFIDEDGTIDTGATPA